MPSIKNISCYFRYLLVSFTLLWALMLNGHEVVAYSAAAPATEQQADMQLHTKAKNEKKTLVKQTVSLEATTSFTTLNLQQVLKPLPLPDFAAPTNEALPVASAVPAGAGFAAQLFPVTIQPNAP
ncbi:RNA methyltransferase [Pontibacter sp. 172403-2]|uniref:RNA methyltransferase n=1 Tax=Pontibacter rufus TaxID=2791028 RepID=UPI001E473185|nr:RNA methyltransferase [Pontibacter sp. 172403-2]